LCLSLRCDFTLEPFTRGLASEDPDQHSEGFVALIAWRSLSCCASRPSIALLSRPNHNAASPSASISAFALSVFASRIAAITQLPDRAAPRTAGRSVLVMAAVSGDFFAQREDYETNETRRLEDSKEVTDR